MQGIAIAVAAALAAAAGDATSAARDPADPAARTRPLVFDSGLRPFAAPADPSPTIRWREHNERVRAIGGHAGAVRGDDAPTAERAPTGGGAEKR
jgi:hypothetical protein